ncbi:AraC family transcriptional regulator [Salinisphaera hydrothermalis]|uniref:AraC family transcriptional regulator n=1 Tax=Salinisphaera hydrothermalis TaxID=563188 RepID=UPI00333F2FCF
MNRIEQRHVAVSMIRSLMYFLERQGLDAAALARRVHLAPDTLADRDRQVASPQYAALMQVGIEATGDPLLGLRFGMAVEPDRWGMLGVLLTHCVDVSEAIRFQLRFQALVSTVGEAALIRGDDTLALRWTTPPATAPALTEEALAAYVAFGRWATGQATTTPTRVHFRHSPQAEHERYETFFRCPVAFEQPHDELQIAPAVLAMPLRNPDDDLKQWLAARAERLRQDNHDHEPRTRLAEWLARQLPFGVPTLDDAAAALALSPRSLQRELDQAGTHFKDCLADVRQQLADHYLRDPSLSIGDIGVLLGFSEQSAFQRAFKRWHGITPRAYRRRLAD